MVHLWRPLDEEQLLLHPGNHQFASACQARLFFALSRQCHRAAAAAQPSDIIRMERGQEMLNHGDVARDCHLYRLSDFVVDFCLLASASARRPIAAVVIASVHS